MNPADQIDAITRRATGAVLAGAHDYSTRRRELTALLLAGTDTGQDPSETAVEAESVHDRLTRAAELAGNATPQILLPADVAQGSPHRGQPGSEHGGH